MREIIGVGEKLLGAGVVVVVIAAVAVWVLQTTPVVSVTTVPVTVGAVVREVVATGVVRRHDATVQLQADIDQADVDWFGPGAPAVFAVDAYPHEIHHGTVAQVRLLPGPGPIAVGYRAILDVPGSRDHLRPGMTAVVAIDGPHRDHVVRVANTAFAFRPTPEMLQSLGETSAPWPGDVPGVSDGNVREVWKYDGQRLSPVRVTAGVTDPDWTEVVSGALNVGDRLATAATMQERRSALWPWL